jgi:hypothetical protein
MALFAFLSFSISWYRDRYVPVYVPDKDLPKKINRKNVDAALKQTHDLVLALRQVDGDPFKVPKELGRLPDAIYASDPGKRDIHTGSFAYAKLRAEPDAISQSDVSVYSDIYVHSDPAYYKGDRVQFNPSGFYIVGWKDGRVSTVAVDDVRVVATGRHGTVPVFPGMKEYDPNGIRLFEVEHRMGGGKLRPEAERLFIRNGPVPEVDCATCKNPKNSSRF